MGSELLEDEEISALCERCSTQAGIDLRHLLTTAGDDELRLTQNAQPALCFMGVGLTRLLRRRGIEPAATAGHSVGEYAALAASEAVDAASVIKAVVERGKAMADAAEKGKDSTVDLVAKIGRSARLGERSRGVLDAGATSAALILQTFATTLSA